MGVADERWTVRLRRNGRLLVAVTSELLLHLGVTSGQPGSASGGPLAVAAAETHHADAAGGGDSYYSAPVAVDGGAGDEGKPLSLMTSLDDDGRSSAN